jgi:hypothetical protein
MSVRDDYPREIAIGFPEASGKQKIQRGSYATGEQFPDKDEWIKLVKMYASTGKHNIYTSVYSEEQKVRNLMDCLFFDFDDNAGGKHSLEDVWLDVKKVAKHLESNYNVQPDVRYSGSKGFHLYIYFDEMEFRNPKMIQQAMKREIVGLGVKTLDLVGEMNRLCRVVYTLNVKLNRTPRLCLPVDLSWSIDKIIKQSKWNTEYMEVAVYPSKRFGKYIKKLNEKHQPLQVWDKVKGSDVTNPLRPCFEDEVVKSKFPPTENIQEQWTSVAWEYLRAGYSVKEVYKLMEKWSGETFKPDTTQYQLEYAKRRDLTPRSCLNLWKIKWCMGEVCPLFEKNVLQKLGDEI